MEFVRDPHNASPDARANLGKLEPLRVRHGSADSDVELRSLDEWRRPAALAHSIGEMQVKKLEARLPESLAEATTVFHAHENYFARSGGLGTVLPHYIDAARTAVRDSILIAPLHREVISRENKEEALNSAVKDEFLIHVPFEHHHLDVRILKAQVGFGEAQHFQYLFEVTNTPHGTFPYFAADMDPYGYRNEPAWQRGTTNSLLVRDSLLAGRITTILIRELHNRSEITDDIVVHANDWQAAVAIPLIKQAILRDEFDSHVNIATHLQLHNTFDQYIDAQTMRHCLGHVPFSGSVIPSCGLYADGPIMTVSEGYAKDFFSNPIVAQFAQHQLGLYHSQGVVGIAHGPFKIQADPFPNVLDNDYLSPKLIARHRMLTSLQTEIERHNDSEVRWGTLTADDGADITNLHDDVPVFLLACRYDLSQKGNDVLLDAITELYRKEDFTPGSAKFVLLQMSKGGQDQVLERYHRVAEEDLRGDLVVFPYGLAGASFHHLMAGASYLLLPSLFEPFGSASEGHASGTPVIATKTGGLAGQVIDYASNPEKSNGFLYQPQLLEWTEQHPEQLTSIAQDLIAFPDRRHLNLLYNLMVRELKETITTAKDVYQSKADAYNQLLSNCYPSTARFSWEKTGSKFGQVWAAGLKK